ARPVLHPALCEPAALEKVGTGVLVVLQPHSVAQASLPASSGSIPAPCLESGNADNSDSKNTEQGCSVNPQAGKLALPGEPEARPTYGRSITVAELLNNDRVLLVKWIRRLTHWSGRQAPLSVWKEKIVPLLEQKLAQLKTPVVRFETQGHKILGLVSIADLVMRVPVDSYGVALWRPVEDRKSV